MEFFLALMVASLVGIYFGFEKSGLCAFLVVFVAFAISDFQFGLPGTILSLVLLALLSWRGLTVTAVGAAVVVTIGALYDPEENTFLTDPEVLSIWAILVCGAVAFPYLHLTLRKIIASEVAKGTRAQVQDEFHIQLHNTVAREIVSALNALREIEVQGFANGSKSESDAKERAVKHCRNVIRMLRQIVDGGIASGLGDVGQSHFTFNRVFEKSIADLERKMPVEYFIRMNPNEKYDPAIDSYLGALVEETLFNASKYADPKFGVKVRFVEVEPGRWEFSTSNMLRDDGILGDEERTQRGLVILKKAALKVDAQFDYWCRDGMWVVQSSGARGLATQLEFS